ncbi:MAG: carboxypeptidase-like regulatory domain-containing protein, partial [Gemmatimonadaceae bacterium]|nr:carboxypeptidase-like regulatory domain-containing protein [Gemmatimonadaceae bacterium]
MTITRTALISCVLVATVTTPLLAQESGRAGRSVYGMVYDSVAARPLVGASVQLAVRDDASAPRIAFSDSAGRYRFDGVPAGRYVLGFYHDALTALGLDAVTRPIEVTADTPGSFDLAIPSSALVRALRCGKSDDFAQGMLVG